MFNRLTGNPITSWIGMATLVIGAVLLGFGKITFNEFLIFLAACGIGLGMKDPKGVQ